MKQAKLNLAAALVLFFASILMVFSTSSTKKVSTSITPALVAPSPAPTITTTWQTYKNDKYGFELQYPSNYSIRSSLESFLELWGPIIYINDGSQRLSISIRVVPKDDGQKSGQICYLSGCILKNSLTKIMVNKIPAWQSDEYLNADGVILKNNKIRSIYIEKSNDFIEIRQERFVEKENEFLTPLNQILSTFKFTK